MQDDSARQSDQPPVAIIGPGRVGSALGILAAKAGWPVVAVGARRLDRARAAAEQIGPGVRACAPAEAVASAGLVLITVTDGAIQDLCGQLAAAGTLARGTVVVHCCGALSSEVLAAARDRSGCYIASAHPLQTFPTAAAAVERLPGTFFFCEGDRPAMEVIERFIVAIAGRAERISAVGPASKMLYHASAVMACNYLVTLIDAALELMGCVGIDRRTALAALAPLVRATVDNVITLGPEQALTGPVSRADTETVGGHLKALAGRCDLHGVSELYRAAGRQTVALALRKGTIDPPAAEALMKLLARPGEEP